MLLIYLVALLYLNAVAADPGETLFLTPLINAGKIDEAIKLSQVEPLIPGAAIESYSGMIAVNQTTNANMFFWYFLPTMRRQENAPLIFWFQGGPGESSLFGQFVEMGPYEIDNTTTAGVKFRDKVPWNTFYNLVFIDSPVGTGFSYAVVDSDYRRSVLGVGDHLFEFLKQFAVLYPDATKNGLYVAGESFAGHFVPAIGHVVYNKMKAGKSPIELKGIIVGNGLSDPETLVPNVGEHLFTLGLLDYPQLLEYRNMSDLFVSLVHQEQWRQATEVFDMLIDHGVVYPYPSLYENSTGCLVYFDFFRFCRRLPKEFSSFSSFVTRDDVRAKLHVGALKFHRQNEAVKQHLVSAASQSVRPYVEELLNSTTVKVLYYTGMNDLLVPPPATNALMQSLNWPGAAAFAQAGKNRIVWSREAPPPDTGRLVNGYVTQADTLTFALIRDAGHTAPYNKPIEAYDMLYRFIENKPFND